MKRSTEAFLHGGGAAISPLEYALFLQSILEFQPTVVAFENILKWRERDKDQEQVFLDQAMRVPKLLLGAELTNTPDPDQAPPEIPSFTQVTGNRGQLAEFTGVGRQPNEDMRLISTLGFINLPEEIGDDLARTFAVSLPRRSRAIVRAGGAFAFTADHAGGSEGGTSVTHCLARRRENSNSG